MDSGFNFDRGVYGFDYTVCVSPQDISSLPRDAYQPQVIADSLPVLTDGPFNSYAMYGDKSHLLYEPYTIYTDKYCSMYGDGHPALYGDKLPSWEKLAAGFGVYEIVSVFESLSLAYTKVNLLSSLIEQRNLLAPEDRKAFERTLIVDRWMIASARRLVRHSEDSCFRPSIDQVEQVIEEAQSERGLLGFFYVSVFDYVHGTGQFAATARRRQVQRVSNCISASVLLLIGIVLRGLARFRAVGWSHRAWFLMHGPRPPKVLGFSSPGASGGGALT